MNQAIRNIPSAHSTTDPGVIGALFAHAHTFPQAPALAQGGQSLSFAEVAAQVRSLSRGLCAFGVQPGDRVVLQVGNSIPGALLLLSTMAIGAIAVPLYTGLQAPELESMLTRLRPAAWFGYDTLYPLIDRIGASLVAPDARFVIDAEPHSGAHRSWQELLTAPASEASDAPAWSGDAHAPALLAVTSGTTGEPKLVAHSQHSLMNASDPKRGMLPPAPRAILVPTPLYFCPGVVFLACTIATGHLLVFPDCRDFDAAAYLDAIERYRCAFLKTSSFGIYEMIKAQRAKPRMVDSLQVCLIAGDVAQDSLYDEFEQTFHCPLHNFLGMTESAGYTRPGTRRDTLLINDHCAMLVDDAGKPVSRGQPGELIVRGDDIFLGYWQAPGVIDDPKIDGWFRTGDILWMDDNDELHYVSRKKLLLIRDGENISPVEVEATLRRHPAIEDAAVAGVPDRQLGQRVIAFVVPGGAIPFSADAVLRDLSSELSDFKVPEMLVVVERIPRTPLRKLDRRAIDKMALHHSLPAQ